MSTLVFFSMNDFTRTSGGTIRMYGVLNELSSNGNQVILISNASDLRRFHSDIKHINLQQPFNSYSKRKFQLLLAFLPLFFFNLYYHKLYRKTEKILQDFKDTRIIFFEYLDNSMGYWFYQNGLIPSYLNDIHGIAAEEFRFQLKRERSFKEKLKLKLKIYAAEHLDKKVFRNAGGIITPTLSMLEFFKTKYGNLVKKDNFILPNVLQNPSSYQPPQEKTVSQIRSQLNLKEDDFIILFAGGFKKSSGLLKLINSFITINRENQNSKLILVGDGPLMKEAKDKVKSNQLEERVYFTGLTRHEDLHNYQALAHILVCPDDDNIFSHLIVHYKYLDALLANKVVINGNFSSVLEINPNEKLSLGYDPGSEKDLTETLLKAIANYPYYKEKYGDTRDFILQNLTYSQQTQILTATS